MPFTQKEQKIFDWGLDNGKSRQEVERAIFKLRSGFEPSAQSPVEEKSTLRKASEVGLGVAKGLTETTVETASLLQKGGQAVIAGVDPRRTFAEVQEQTGFESLKGDQLEGVRETLRAKTPEEKTGKIIAFGAELLAPTAKTGITKLFAGAERGKKAIGLGSKNATDEIQSLIERGVIKAEDALNPIDAGVETVLKRTDKNTFNTYVETARKAITEPKAPTGLEVAGKKAEDALDTIQRKLKEFGQQKGTILDKASVGNKPVGNIAVKFRQNLDNFVSGKTLDTSDTKMIKDISKEAEKLGNNPSAKEVDKFIDFVQDKVYTSQKSLTIDVTDEATGAVRRFSGELNEALKTALPDSYRNANKQFADLVGLRNELNKKLGKEGERAGSLMKRVFSPSDARTKEMFQEVLDVTNVDLVDEAVLARYTMDVFGDSRQRSLLQSVLEDQGSLSGRVLKQATDFILGNFKGDEAELRKALRIIQQSGQ